MRFHRVTTEIYRQSEPRPGMEDARSNTRMRIVHGLSNSRDAMYIFREACYVLSPDSTAHVILGFINPSYYATAVSNCSVTLRKGLVRYDAIWLDVIHRTTQASN